MPENEANHAIPSTDVRRILMVSSAFPPSGGPGVQRSQKFAKFLPRFGWLPTVWTLDHMDGLPKDATLLDELPPEVTIHRWNRGRRVRRLQRSIRHMSKGKGLAKRLLEAIDWRLESWVIHRPWPDEQAGWAQSSLRPLERLIKEESIDAIYSTYSPGSNHLLALGLKERTGLPWVADFRDLWTDDLRYGEPSPKRRRADTHLQQRILETADIVVGVSPLQTKLLARHVPEQARKFVTITNGFDPSDFEPLDTKPAGDREEFVLASIGRLDRWRVHDAWLEGLKRFGVALGDRHDSFLFRVIGQADPQTLSQLKATGIRYSFSGYESHRRAVRQMQQADAFLLPTGHHPRAKSEISAKLFEYLASQRPILYVGAEDGACARIVRSCGAGPIVPFEAQAVADALGTLHSAWEAGQPWPGCTPERAAPYNRITLTKNLAAVLDRLVGRTPTVVPVDQVAQGVAV